jgi:hypothetical protein
LIAASKPSTAKRYMLQPLQHRRGLEACRHYHKTQQCTQ